MQQVKVMRIIAIAAAVFIFAATAALAEEAKYVPWGVDEYEFFGLTKQQLAARFKKVIFRDDMRRVLLSPQPGNCAGYDGPTFELGFAGGKVSTVQRVFVGCKETQYGPTFTTKVAALQFAIAGLSEHTAASEKAKLKAARAELSALQAGARP